MRLWKRKSDPLASRRLESGQRTPDFRLPSVQGGLFCLEMRIVHGPVALVFVHAGDESYELLQELNVRHEEFRRAGAYNYAYSNPEIKAAGKPSSRAGLTVAVVVRAVSMNPVRGLQKRIGLPFYVLWDEQGRVSTGYGATDEEAVAAVVEMDGHLAWLSEPGESPRAEQILQNIQKATDPSGSGNHTPATAS